MSVNEVKIKKAPIDFQIRGTESNGYSRTFCIGDEDHTLGNALRHVMMQNSKVSFAAYSVPHPSEPIVHIRVQTATPSSDGETQITAIDALKESCETLIDQCQFMLDKMEECMPEVKEDRLKIEEFVANEGVEGEDMLVEGDEGQEVFQEGDDAMGNETY